MRIKILAKLFVGPFGAAQLNESPARRCHVDFGVTIASWQLFNILILEVFTLSQFTPEFEATGAFLAPNQAHDSRIGKVTSRYCPLSQTDD